jgi:hypothetical protein
VRNVSSITVKEAAVRARPWRKITQSSCGAAVAGSGAARRRTIGIHGFMRG